MMKSNVSQGWCCPRNGNSVAGRIPSLACGSAALFGNERPFRRASANSDETGSRRSQLSDPWFQRRFKRTGCLSPHELFKTRFDVVEAAEKHRGVSIDLAC
ncbi:hypothetical protein SI859A1_01513 [Aurantimonas manganoxydans SI85-9A1]|uniref:Uncharacterized protein n=1 Tax=Aurantimonas manganoxydans (strain ATCC BAA-1229 / DSM 21871 / SI85-9A1) TaxID=287752 RepID=Q1YIG6_AURMS|nr:hypothetical protein SI859A1_01513 [Aurantimonas manganoxydans SI85-9A1]